MDDRTLHNELVGLQRGLAHSMSDYVNATRRMIYMVRAVDLTFESLYEGNALQRAIWRYEALWLPLLAAIAEPPPSSSSAAAPNSSQPSLSSGLSTASNTATPFKPVWPNSAFASKVDDISAKNFSKGGLWLSPATIVPPIDIAWVWHCHRLNPVAYSKDLARFARDGDTATADYMRRACATTIDTAFRFSDGEDTQSKPTRRLWDIVYPFESYVPKYILSHSFAVEETRKRRHITSYANEITRSSFRSVLQYDLETAALLQKAFLYQIVDENDIEKGEYFETNDFLERAYRRYLQFIVLHKDAPEVFLVPMNDINIIWHMHLSATSAYNHDCNALVGFPVNHDPTSVEKMRLAGIAEMEEERIASGEADIDPAVMEDDEFAELQQKRQRGIAVKDTKALWETVYGSTPRYDLPDTRYRGQPTGARGGFYENFTRMNGTNKDITWPETVLRMIMAILVVFAGCIVLLWAFYKTMVSHGKFILGLPTGVAIMGLGAYIFFAIPISRPLSSDSRFWLERAYRQTHDPLPPYLVSSQKKAM